MNSLILASVGCGLVALSVSVLSDPGGKLVGGHPSRSYVSQEVLSHPARFAFYEQPDCRLLFCDRVTLLDRIRRSVVIVDDISMAMVMGADISAREHAVRKSMTVAKFLKLVGLKHSGRGQPQLRLVKKNTITQTPIATDTGQGTDDFRIFLSQKVEPGDFLIITPSS